MSIDFNTGKVNNTTKFSDTVGSTISNTTVNGSGNVEMKIDNKLLERLKLLGMDNPEDMYAILEKCQKDNIDITVITDEELQKIVTEYNDSKVANTEESDKISESTPVDSKTQKPETNIQESEKKPDFKEEYNKKDLKGKIDDCYNALAQNIYKSGFKGKDGNEILKPNSLGKSWNELSKPEQEQFIQRIRDFIDNDERLKAIKEQFVSTDKVSDNEKTMAVDALMRGILAADQMELSYVDYLKKNEFERAEIVENYLNGDDSKLNKNDEYLKNQYSVLNKKVSEILKERTGVDVGNNLDASDVNRYIKDLNLSKDELIYSDLKEKADKGTLKGNDKDIYNRLAKIYESPTGKERSKESKAYNLHNLEVRYNELKSKANLSSEEKRSLELIEQTLNSKESQELKKLYSEMPKPSEKENVVLDEVKGMLKGIEEHVQGSDLESGFLIQEIEKKFAGKSQQEKEDYIKTYLKYDKSNTANRVYAYYLQKGLDIQSKETIDLGALNIDKTTDKQAETHHKHVLDAYNSDNKYYKKHADLAIETEHKILTKSGTDFQKVSYTDLTLNTGNTEHINRGIDVNNAIKDDELKDKGVEKIFTHKNTKAENGIYALSKIKEAGKSQGKVLELTTGRWKEAAAYAAENKTVANMDKEYQTKGFETLHTNINKHFDGEEAIKYSNSLADQIKYCDKSNQLDMHKEIMTSKYSEVVEHAAGNIKDYDASVQAEAFESVISTGNTAAIETAYANLASSPNVVQDAANLRGIIETSLESSKAEELAKKIKSGATLTREEYDSLTEIQKQEYKAAYFKSLSPAKQVELVTKISDVNTKKSVFKKIAQQNPALLKEIVEHDAASAEFVYDMHIADDLVLSVAKRKSASIIQFANLAQKIEKANLEKSGKSEADETQAKKYMDSPFDALKIKNKKNNNIYLA